MGGGWPKPNVAGGLGVVEAGPPKEKPWPPESGLGALRPGDGLEPSIGDEVWVVGAENKLGTGGPENGPVDDLGLEDPPPNSSGGVLGRPAGFFLSSSAGIGICMTFPGCLGRLGKLVSGSVSTELSAADLVGDAPDMGGLARGELTVGIDPKGLLPLTPGVVRPNEKPPDDASGRFTPLGGEGSENADEVPVSGFAPTGELTGVVLSAGLDRRSARGVVVPSADGERASAASANTYEESVSTDGSSSSSVPDPSPSPSVL